MSELVRNAEELINQAEISGVVLSQNDKQRIYELSKKNTDLLERADRLSGSDPMNKGKSFPMGVGFTRMTKRKERAIDSSVRTAGEAVELYRQAKTLKTQLDNMLQGKGTEADEENKINKKQSMQKALIGKLLNHKKGDVFGKYTIDRVNIDRDGYPSTYTISGPGIIKGVWDKVDIASDFFGGDKVILRNIVDEYRNSVEKD